VPRQRCWVSPPVKALLTTDQCLLKVAGQSADEDGRVQNDDDPFESGRKDVVAQFVDVVVVADAKVVGAVTH